MSFRVKRDRYGNSTRHEFGKFEDVCVRRIFRVGPIEGKDGAPVMINDSLIINGDIIVSGDLQVSGTATFCNEVEIDTLKAKTDKITINDSLCINGDLVVNGDIQLDKLEVETLQVSGTATFCDEVKLDTLKAKNEKITIDDSLCITGNLVVNGFICNTEVINATANATITNDYTKTFIEGNEFGKVDWATRIASTSIDQGFGISLNDNGDIVVVGYYNRVASIYNADGTTGTTLANDGNMDDVFIAKYNCDGILQWATRIAGSENDRGNAISLNDNGDIVVTGFYRSNPVTIYNADGTTAATLANSVSSDVFIVKYTSEGILEWATRIAGSEFDAGNEISLNDNGDIVVTGFYLSNPVTIYNADGTTGTTLANSGSSDVFIVKYNCGGKLQWATRIAGSGNDRGNGISLNDNGDIVVTGFYADNSVTIYNADGTTGATLVTSGFDDVFIVKYNCVGTVQWATRIASSLSDSGNGISLNDNGDIVVTGFYSSDPVMIYNADGTTGATLVTSGFEDAFIVKYNCVGTVQWATRIAGSLSESGNGISLNDNGDIVVTGLYESNQVTIYNANGTTGATLANNGSEFATFIVKYNSEGILQWTARASGSGMNSIIGYDVSLNNNDEIVVTGRYQSNATIYNADGTTGATLINSGSSDVFIAKYTDNITMLLENGVKTGNEKIIVSDCSQLKINAQIKDKSGKEKSKMFLRDGQLVSLYWSEKSNKWIINNNEGANIV